MFNGIGDLLSKTIKRSGIYKQVEANQILEAYTDFVNHALPGHISDKVKPLYLKNKILHVASLSSLITQELKFRETEIIDHLNKSFGSSVINKIRYIT